MKLTPTQARIYELLLDGMPHAREELRGLLNDEMALENGKAVDMAVSRLRNAIEDQGEDVVARFGVYYLVRRVGRASRE